MNLITFSRSVVQPATFQIQPKRVYSNRKSRKKYIRRIKVLEGEVKDLKYRVKKIEETQYKQTCKLSNLSSLVACVRVVLRLRGIDI